MSLEEIEQELYRNTMQIRSIEAEIVRVSPFSKEFEKLVEKSLQLQKEQCVLGADRAHELQKLYEKG